MGQDSWPGGAVVFPVLEKAGLGRRLAIITISRLALITISRLAIITISRLAIINISRLAIITISIIAIITISIRAIIIDLRFARGRRGAALGITGSPWQEGLLAVVMIIRLAIT